MRLSFISRVFNPKTTEPETELRAIGASTPGWGELIARANSSAGVPVNEANVLGLPAFYAAIKLKSEAVGSLPFNVFAVTNDGDSRKLARDTSLFTLLMVCPNPFQTPFEMLSYVVASVEIRGNAYIQIIRANSGEITALNPLPAPEVHPEFIKGLLVYIHRDALGKETLFRQEEIIHLRGMLSVDGITGLSVVEVCKNSLGLSLSLDQYAASNIKNGALPAGAIITPEKIPQDIADGIVTAWNKQHGGSGNAGKVGLLHSGTSIETIGFSAKDTQLLESRQFSVFEVARITGVPPFMLGAMDGQALANTEQQSLQFLNQSLTPTLTKIEQAFKKSLARDLPIAFDFDTSSMTRADTSTQAALYASAIQNGWRTRDEVRGLNGLNPLEDGTGGVAVLQQNLAPLGSMTPPMPTTAVPSTRALEVPEAETRAIGDEVAEQQPTLPTLVDTSVTTFLTKAAEMLAKEVTELETAEPSSNAEEFFVGYRATVVTALESMFREQAAKVHASLGESDTEEFLSTYTEFAADRWLQKTRQDLTNPPTNRAANFAGHEAVRLSNALALEIFKAQGVTAVRWVSRGTGAERMDGKVIDLSKDERFEGSLRHPPLGPGDRSTIEPA